MIATAAAIIASQALISGAFSITRQAVQLGLAPRLDVQHTSAREMGQVYVPRVNWALMVATVVIVIGFGSSSAMAAAYGIAVTLTMIITVLLLFIVMTERWRWPTPLAVIVMGVFLTIDLAFFGANALKIMQGGWLPLVVAAVLFTLMTTWRTGRHIVRRTAGQPRRRRSTTSSRCVDFMKPARVPGTAVYMTAQSRRHSAGAGAQPAIQQGAARARRHSQHHDGAAAATAPRKSALRWSAGPRPLQRAPAIRVHGGSATCPERCWPRRARCGMKFDFQDVVYFLGRETILVKRHDGMALWREKLFVLMSRNAVRATAYFRLPTERVVELGVQVEM